MHLAHPLGVRGFEYGRVKNDERDAKDLADLLRLGWLPEAWIAPPETRELRELVRHGRGRRRHPVRHRHATGLLGRADPEAPRVRRLIDAPSS